MREVNVAEHGLWIPNGSLAVCNNNDRVLLSRAMRFLSMGTGNAVKCKETITGLDQTPPPIPSIDQEQQETLFLVPAPDADIREGTWGAVLANQQQHTGTFMA